MELVLSTLNQDAAVCEADPEAADVDVFECLFVSDVLVKCDILVVLFSLTVSVVVSEVGWAPSGLGGSKCGTC
jgi:hypothetical protein